jgi:hypothetical protein
MTYVPQNVNVYTAAFAGAIAGSGVPNGAFIIDPVTGDYAPVTIVAAVFAQAVDTAWGAGVANQYDVDAIEEVVCNILTKGAGWPITGAVTTQSNWTVVATAIVALVRQGDVKATSDGVVFPALGGGVTPKPITTTQQVWVATWGSDTTGDGSQYNPFLTIAHAQSVILDASATKTYQILVYIGNYTASVALKPFTEIVGLDPTQDITDGDQVRITGDITLATGFSTAGAVAWLSNIAVFGFVTLDFVGSSSTDGLVSITNCQVNSAYTATMGALNIVELHNSTLFGDCILMGGTAIWENSTGTGSTLHVKASTAPSCGAILNMYDSVWTGNVSADQNSNTTGGQVVAITLSNSEMCNGTLTITAAGANCPTVDGAYGATPENPILAGSAAAALSHQMRISTHVTVPTGTLISALGGTDVMIPLPATDLGATSIESLHCTLTPVGALWATELVNKGCLWNLYVAENAGTAEVHVAINNPTDTPVTTGNNLTCNLAAFYPKVLT